MTRRLTQLAWSAATATYFLIILGAIVRITGSGLGCGDHWPLCNGHVIPPLDLPTMIEWGHRLVAAAVSVLVVALAALVWLERRAGDERGGRVPSGVTAGAAYGALGLLVVQIALGAITVKLELPAWTVVLHLGTAMLLLGAILVAARGRNTFQPGPAALGAAALGFVAILLGALTANLGAARACTGFPLCSGAFLPTDPAQHIQWTHRLLAYALAVYVVVWALASRARGPRYVLALILLQVIVAAAMVELALPRLLQAAHVAAGAGVWAGLVLAAL